MSKYKYILWDFDGTISDSAIGIVNSVSYALERIGTPLPAPEVLRKFVGPPLAEGFTRYVGFTPEVTEKAVVLFRKYFEEKGILENEMYPGIPELLCKLRDAGYVNIIATSKPEPFARKIIERYGITDLFKYIAGSTYEETRTKKEEVIAYALESCGISDKSQVVMVGDRSYDALGAAANGIDCIGVLYGYGDREEFEEAGVVAVAETLDELEKLFL